MTAWPVVPLSSTAAAKGIVGGPFGSSLVGTDYIASGIPVIRGTNLNGGREISGDFVFVSMAKFTNELARNAAVPGDLIFTQRGTLGQVALVPDGPHPEYVVSQSQMRLRVDPAAASSKYLYYACSSQVFARQVRDNAIATGVPHINLGILSRLEVPLPSIQEQRGIAEVLGALDDKIAANNNLSATGDEYLASLAEHMLASCESAVRLGQIADINAITVKPTVGKQLRYVDIASIGVGHYDYPKLTDWADAPGRARRRIRRGDTIWSTVRPNRRSHALNLTDDPALVGSTGLAVISPREVGFAYLYQLTKRSGFTAYLESAAEGSAYPAVRADRFADASVPMAEPREREAFEAVAAPIREHIHSLAVENRHLATLRDALLPTLMSGELRVKDAERLAGAAK